MATIVSDFDGTIVPMTRYEARNIATNLSYIQGRQPNSLVTDAFVGHTVVVVTGRTETASVWSYLRAHNIQVRQVICAPKDIHIRKHSGLHLRQWKARIINRIRPDVVYDDDAETLQMVDCKVKYLVHHTTLSQQEV